MNSNINYWLWGIIITIFLIVFLKKILRSERRYIDFIVGDDGEYSLSRLQAILWAIAIISFQVSVFLIFALNYENKYSIDDFHIVLSEEIMYLLSLSFGSYIVVKGISVERIANKKEGSERRTGKWSDLITGSNGLDFSKFQMLIWTLLALTVFTVQSNKYLKKIINSKDSNSISELFMSKEEKKNYNNNIRKSIEEAHQSQISEIKKDTIKVNNILLNEDSDDLPTVSWSFIILMGLSTGVYVGKKLIPTSKVNEVRTDELKKLAEKRLTLNSEIKGLELAKAQLSKDTKNFANSQSIIQLNLQLEKKKLELSQINLDGKKIKDSVKEVTQNNDISDLDIIFPYEPIKEITVLVEPEDELKAKVEDEEELTLEETDITEPDSELKRSDDLILNEPKDEKK